MACSGMADEDCSKDIGYPTSNDPFFWSSCSALKWSIPHALFENIPVLYQPASEKSWAQASYSATACSPTEASGQVGNLEMMWVYVSIIYTILETLVFWGLLHGKLRSSAICSQNMSAMTLQKKNYEQLLNKAFIFSCNGGRTFGQELLS